jgi:two-component system nitrogen regulation response regulator NtrX
MNTVYIVDDDPKICASLSTALTRQGYTVGTASSPQEFIDHNHTITPAVVIVDICFGETTLDGQDLIAYITEKMPDTRCIVISGESDTQKVLSCLKAGASDYIEKPVSLARLLTTVKNAVSLHHYRSDARSRSHIIGSSDAIVKTIQRIRKLAVLNETVLIRGESGSGKELVADNLHLLSYRATAPFVKINCTALNPNLIESELFGHQAGSFTGASSPKRGLFESANGGTLFIDEIGDFPIHLQSKILRVLQEHTILPVGATTEIPIDIRIIAATHRDLETMVTEGTFREDLLYRIATFSVTVPPLRERISDIEELSYHFLHQFISSNNLPSMTFSPDALMKLKTYTFPGNIRELSSLIKNAAFNSDGTIIEPHHIDFGNGKRKEGFWIETDTLPLDDAERWFRKNLLSRRLKYNSNNVRKTAESLGILPTNLYRMLKGLEIGYSEHEE